MEWESHVCKTEYKEMQSATVGPSFRWTENFMRMQPAKCKSRFQIDCGRR